MLLRRKSVETKKFIENYLGRKVKKAFEEQNKQTKQKPTHRYRGQTDGCQMGEGWGTGWKRWRDKDVQISSYKIDMGL